MRTKPLSILKYEEPKEETHIKFPSRPRFENAFKKLYEAFEDAFEDSYDAMNYPKSQEAKDIESNCLSFLIGNHHFLDGLFDQLESEHGTKNAADMIGFSLKAVVYGSYLEIDEFNLPDLISDAIKVIQDTNMERSLYLQKVKENPLARVVVLSQLLNYGDLQKWIVMGIHDSHIKNALQSIKEIRFLLGESNV